MKRDLIVDLYHRAPQDGVMVTVAGWVHAIEPAAPTGFMEVNDGSFLKNLRVVFNAGRLPDSGKAIGVGASVRVSGTLALTPGAQQPFEVNAAEIVLVGGCEPGYPLQQESPPMEPLREIPHLRARAATFRAAFRVRSVASYAVHRYFNENGFVYIHTPIITSCGDADELFRVTTLPPGETDYSRDFFARKACLAASGQMEAESMALAFGKVYNFGPAFRAENADTPRHAAEFWMIEPEMAFCDLAGGMDVAEDMVKYVVEYVMERCPDEMNYFNEVFDNTLEERMSILLTTKFDRITYTEAIAVLEKHSANFQQKPAWGANLQPEHERYLTEQLYKRPVFVTNYPKELKSFDVRQNDDGKTVAACNLLVPGVGELLGGSQHEERPAQLETRMDEMGLAADDYRWYRDLRRFGTVPHAGFGLGFERMMMYLTGIPNIRDVLPFPRTMGGFV